MNIVRLEKVVAGIERKIKDLDDAILDLWFWRPQLEKRTGEVVKYIQEIKEDIFRIANDIKIRAAELR